MAHRVFPAVLVLILSSFAAHSAAADTVRVIAAQAAVRLNADPNSLTVATVSAGTVLEVNRRQGAWYSVWLPPEREGGQRRLGFLAASDGELIADTAVRSQPAAAPSGPLGPPQAIPPQRNRSSGDFEGFGGVTFKLPGARAIVSSGGVTADSGEHNTLPTFGILVSGWLGESRILGIFGEFSGIDGGTAFAQVGSLRSEVSGSAANFHGGWQFQYPGQIRPYVLGGVGVFLQKTVTDFTANGAQISSSDETDHFLSYLFGGGVRFMIGERGGVKVGLEALSVKVGDASYVNYGRFVGGAFVSF